jgi:threonine dehydrogenase-like Zn-dependent dehydrogenase
MKAVVIEKPNKVMLKEVPDPIPKANEVLIKPKVCGLCGTDVHIYDGNFIGDYPVIPCHEFAGEVAGLGKNVEGIKIGDSVAIDPNIRCGVCLACREGKVNICSNYEAVGVTRPGGFAELVCVPSRNIYKLKNPVYSDAAFAEPLACVLYGLSRLDIWPGSQIIIWGAGAIGLIHTVICKTLYGANLTIVDIDPNRVKRAIGLGLANVFVSDNALSMKLQNLKPQGYEIGIEATGCIEAAKQLFSHLRRGGQALLFGVYPKDMNLSLSPFEIFLNDWKIVGSFTYQHQFNQSVQIINDEKIKFNELADLKIKLEEVPEVLVELSKGKRIGKVQVIT